MPTKIQQIINDAPRDSVLFGSWLASKGLPPRSQHSYVKSGWLDHIAKGVYALNGTTPKLLPSISSYNKQLHKSCIVGAFTALDLRGLSHFVPMGKPKAYLFANKKNKLPQWLLNTDWDMTIRYMTTDFLGEGLPGVETMLVDQHELLVASPERAIMECLYLPEASTALLDIFYIMEGLTTLRPSLLQSLLESCKSQKTKRLFLYMAQKAGHRWFKALDTTRAGLGTTRLMISPTGKYIKEYNMTIPKELARYE